MSAFPDLRAAVEATIAQVQMPGMVVAAVRDQGPVEVLAVGEDAAGHPLERDSLFSVASITKLGTAIALLRLVERGAIDLDDELRAYVPDAVASATDGTTIRALMSHTAGMPGDPDPPPPWTLDLDWRAYAAACERTARVTRPHTRVQYSNLDYALLGIVIERASGTSYQEALRGLGIEPLGIEAYIGQEPPRPTAVTINPGDGHAGTELSWPNSRFARSLGYPDYGLVTTAEGALALVRVFADVPGGILSRAMTAEARSDQVGDLGGGVIGYYEWERAPWGLGPEIRGRKSPYWAPVEASQESFGHAGASGCLAWCDPAAGVAYAWLGTRGSDTWMNDPALPINAALFGHP